MRCSVFCLAAASLLFAFVSSTLADATIDTLCQRNVEIGGYHFDISPLMDKDSIVERTVPALPVEQKHEYTFNLCQKIARLADTPDHSQCKDNTRFCERTIIANHPQYKNPLVIDIHPIGDFADDPLEFSAFSEATPNDESKASKLIVTLKNKNSATSASAKVTVECADQDSDPTYVVDSSVAFAINWKNRVGCGQKQDITSPPPDDNNNAPSPRRTSGVTIFFIILLVGIAVYFGVGIFYNSRTYNARGWDLLPHSDFWRDLPYLIKDLFMAVYNSVSSRRPGGYMSV